MVLSNDQIIQYLRRSYTWVDGFWFLEVENNLDSFETTLGIDIQVWIKVTRQQAKLAFQLLDCSKNDIPTILETLKVKWHVDGHSYELEDVEINKGQVIIRKCPWFEAMKRSGREHLVYQVCGAVCPPLYQTWGKTINPNVQVRMVKALGKGDNFCEIQFSTTHPG